jgi:DNA primase
VFDLAIDVADFLDELGVQKVQQRGEEVFYSCPFEGHAHGDQNMSATMNVDTTVWHCFGCGRSGNAIHFVSVLEGVSPAVARRMIRERFGRSENLSPDALVDRLKKGLTPPEVTPELMVMVLPEKEQENRRLLWRNVKAAGDAAPEALRYMLTRLDADVLDRFEFGYDHISGYITFPFRNHAGQLIGLKGRYPGTPPDGVPKYKVLGDKYEDNRQYGFDTLDVSRAVWGIHLLPDHVDSLVICEGELNAMACRILGKEAVGLAGQFMSGDQAQTIMRSTDHAILVYDDITKGLDAADKLRAIHTDIVPPHDKDPMDMRPFDLERLLHSATHPLWCRLPKVY